MVLAKRLRLCSACSSTASVPASLSASITLVPRFTASRRHCLRYYCRTVLRISWANLLKGSLERVQEQMGDAA